MPALCQAHRVVFQGVARAESKSPFAAVADIFDRFMNGGRLSESDLRNAYNNVDDIIRGARAGDFSGLGSEYHPPSPPRAAQGHNHGHAHPPPGQHEPFNQAPPPPRDTEADHVALLRARKLLGFSQTEIVTAESLKARHRDLAKKHHPDRGGSLAKMQAINAAVDTVAASL